MDMFKDVMYILRVEPVARQSPLNLGLRFLLEKRTHLPHQNIVAFSQFLQNGLIYFQKKQKSTDNPIFSPRVK